MTPTSLSRADRGQLLQAADRLGFRPEPDVDEHTLAEMILLRRQMLEDLDRDCLVELLRWADRPVVQEATALEMARELMGVRKMTFAGLSPEALRALAVIRGIDLQDDAEPRRVIRAMKDTEPIWDKLSRKRRRLVGKLLSNVIGDVEAARQRQSRTGRSLKERIEEHGVVGGLADGLRGAADEYIAAKLDEIEHRIDTKLDQIDQRLAEWRDREIANRLRIIKITLVASVIVALISLAYAYFSKYVLG